MRFTPRERASAYVSDLLRCFSEWMEEWDEFIDLRIEAEDLSIVLRQGEEDELGDEEVSNLINVTSELMKW